MKRLFGTDGIRGVAGVHPLDPPTVRKLGIALGESLGSGRGPVRVVLGRDTRESGAWLCRAVATGLHARGVEPVDAGVISTPGLAYVLRAAGCAAGVMISASHNPFEDNGIKIFGDDGAKLSDELERRIESRLLDEEIDDGHEEIEPLRDASLVESYKAYLRGTITAPRRFDGLRVVLDCANGSATAIAPEVFRHHGAEVLVIGDAPDGRNINLECGSTHMDGLARAVRRHRAHLGLAFDGDADRCLAVDSRGRLLDGDHILYIFGRRLKHVARLPGDAVVATIMSNFWLEERLGSEGIKLHRAPVGDKYVLERMLTEGADLGGEQSGHIIVRRYASTGDGILTALLLLDTLCGEGETLEQILDSITPYPQVLLNVPVGQKPNLREHPRIGPLVAEIESRLRGSGRVVLRYSGTEPLARVMLEGRDRDEVREQAQRLADLIEKELGA